jgi:hypothetical protein
VPCGQRERSLRTFSRFYRLDYLSIAKCNDFINVMNLDVCFPTELATEAGREGELLNNNAELS